MPQICSNRALGMSGKAPMRSVECCVSVLESIGETEANSMMRASFLGFLLIVAPLLAGCDNKPAANAAPPPPPVTVARPLQKTITEWDEYTGRFTAIETVEVRARVSGFIDSIHFNEGQMVRRGDLLFVIDQRPYELAVEQAKAEVERAKAKLEIASLD